MTTYQERHIYYTIAGTFIFVGAALGPLIGGLIEATAMDSQKNWSRWLVPIVSFVTILPYTFLCTESYASILARKRLQSVVKKRNESKTGSEVTLVEGIGPLNWTDTLKDLQSRYGRALKLPVLLAIKEPLIICVTIYVSLVYFFIYCTLEAFPYTFGKQRGWTMTQVSLTYISLLVGFFISTIVPLCTTQQRYIFRIVTNLPPGAKMRPEARLSDMLWCCFVAPAGLFIFAWTAPFPQVHWIAPMIGMVMFAFAVNVAFTDFLPYLADV